MQYQFTREVDANQSYRGKIDAYLLVFLAKGESPPSKAIVHILYMGGTGTYTLRVIRVGTVLRGV